MKKRSHEYMSESLDKLLSSYVIDSKMIWECRKKRNEVGKKNKVFFIWVPAIRESKETKSTIHLPKRARMSLIGPEPFCGIGEYTYKKEFLEREKAEKEKLWRNLPGMDHSTKFLRKFETARSKRYMDVGKK